MNDALGGGGDEKVCVCFPRACVVGRKKMEGGEVLFPFFEVSMLFFPFTHRTCFGSMLALKSSSTNVSTLSTLLLGYTGWQAIP